MLTNMQRYFELSTKIYDVSSPKQYWRIFVFIARSISRNKEIKELMDWFERDSWKRSVAAVHPYIFEQATRYFFYHNSTLSERLTLIREHFLFCGKIFNEEGLRSTYLGQGIKLWETDYENKNLSLTLHFDGGHKKEGLIAISFMMADKLIYRIIFWFTQDKDNKPALKVGALQGTQEGAKTIRDLTKYFFGYRPKNFILYSLRIVAQQLGIKRIYAVSNYGFYTNNHVRIDRKLKTSLDKFWEETG